MTRSSWVAVIAFVALWVLICFDPFGMFCGNGACG